MDYPKWHKAQYGDVAKEAAKQGPEFRAREGYSADVAHHVNFYKGIRDKAPIKEDALFGMRAGGPALASNKSFFEKRIIEWDPGTATVKN